MLKINKVLKMRYLILFTVVVLALTLLGSVAMADTQEVMPVGESIDIRYFDGKVGIGTTAANAKLTIGNNVATDFLDSYGEYQTILYDGGTGGASYGFGVKSSYMIFNSNTGYSFDSGGNATRMVIDTSGKVGIGTTSPTAKLDVAGDVKVAGDLGVGGNIVAATGRSATLVVAASTAAALSKAQANYVCDGIADNVEIQAAIDALPAAGGKVQLLEGTFYLAAPIQIKTSSTTLAGVGLSTVLKPANNANCNGITMTAHIGTVIIEKMTLDGNKANNTYGRAIDFTNTYDMRFKDLHISSWKENGLYASNTEHMSQCDFDTILVITCGGDGVYINGGTGFDISGLYMSKVWVIANGGYGMRLLNITDPSLSQCTFDSNVGAGLRTDTVNYLRFAECFVGGNNFTGMDLNSTYCSRITGSTFDNDRNPGVQGGVSIDIDGACYKIIVANNQIVHTLEASNIGVWVRNGATGILVTGNISWITAGDLVVGTATVRDNLGWVTENSGTATIASAQTSVDVTHGLCAAPTRVQLTPTTNTGNGPNSKAYWVSAKGTSTFTISLSSDYTSPISFDWRAVVGEGN